MIEWYGDADAISGSEILPQTHKEAVIENVMVCQCNALLVKDRTLIVSSHCLSSSMPLVSPLYHSCTVY